MSGQPSPGFRTVPAQEPYPPACAYMMHQEPFLGAADNAPSIGCWKPDYVWQRLDMSRTTESRTPTRIVVTYGEVLDGAQSHHIPSA
jgi:hypothetical protein